jgi:hypothetical protein
MFGRYPLSLKRRIVGAILVIIFVWRFYAYVSLQIYYDMHVREKSVPTLKGK